MQVPRPDLSSAEVGQVIAEADAAVYFSRFGLNLFDIALAARVLREAVSRGVGTLLALD